jgi:hypothetical protein
MGGSARRARTSLSALFTNRRLMLTLPTAVNLRMAVVFSVTGVAFGVFLIDRIAAIDRGLSNVLVTNQS